jgi:diphosphomevalonate decarboxylase
MKYTAIAHPNIALIKYWGKRDIPLNLPSVSSLSMTLSQFFTRTHVEWGSKEDTFILNKEYQSPAQAARVFYFLDLINPKRPPCSVESSNNFPTAAGLASSSSAFAALALAATAASGNLYTQKELSILARQGSGSASRSIWGGWVRWDRGNQIDGLDSHGIPIAPVDHWDVCMIIAIVSAGPKSMGSTKGMIASEQTSPFYSAWVDTAEEDVQRAQSALQQRDIHTLGTCMEHSTIKMHATMMTTQPTIRYWKPKSLALIDLVEQLRTEGFSCYQTMDAGPNVKILCPKEEADRIAKRIRGITPCHILEPGPNAHLL